MDQATRLIVRQRANSRCEYCHIPDFAYPITFHVEHIVASVHQRNDELSNLAWACPPCNAHKGPNLATIDPSTGEQVSLFNPRIDLWEDHFRMANFAIVGITSTGRGTVRLLDMNQARRIELRQAYLDE